MKQFTRKWWGETFISALEKFTLESRLARGRSYARNGKVVGFSNKKNVITATVKGSVNPYFGVYTAPYYDVEISLKPISEVKWKKIIQDIGSQPYYLSHLLTHQMPDDIEDVFNSSSVSLLPSARSDFITTSCSCPDYEVPCKHIAGVYYLISAQLDDNPLLLFELRGLPLEQLIAKLEETPLGQALAKELKPKEQKLEISNSFYPEVTFSKKEARDISSALFWHGTGTLPSLPNKGEKQIPAVLVKKQGDFPQFWEANSSFIAWMEDVYGRVGKGVVSKK